MVRFDNVYVTPRVRVALHSIFGTAQAKKFWDLVDKLRSGQFEIPGLRVEKLHSKKGKIYSARINVEMRVIFSMYSSPHGGRSLVIWDANHHDDAYDRIERAAIPAVFQPENSNYLEPVQTWGQNAQPLSELSEENADHEEITAGLLLFKVPHFVLAEPQQYKSFERNIDRYLRLSEEQEELLQKTDKAYLVRGSAGTGKTSLALFYALNLYEQNMNDDIFFFTYQEELASVCRCYKVNLLEEEQQNEDESGGVKVFSYLEFCKHYLRKIIDPSQIKWQWIDRTASLKHLQDIISSRSRWSRSVKAEDAYSYVYSILKGRFVPGSDRLPASAEDFRRIFRGYGAVPKNLEDILEIYGHYDERLARLQQRDEADLIRYCYQNLKERAILSPGNKAPWIIIDEIQDFTELEWKSILLFWENQVLQDDTDASYPFLAGDRNQNISRSGFRWPEVDSYIEGTLKKIHRPNAVQKVQLHRNFRNSRQIFDLGTFVRSLAPEAGGDLGSPPELQGHKPIIVVGQPDEFTEFLSLINNEDTSELPAPLVVAFEDNESQSAVRRRLNNDDGIFLLPLRVAKGMEFEDLIIYRLFSSLAQFGSDISDDDSARLFDLWYMGITRARQNLLIFLTPSDLERLSKLCGDRFNELEGLVEIVAVGAQARLLKFFHQREKYLPNYAVIFLERLKAQESWDEYKTALAESPDGNHENLKEKAIRLWKRCRDNANLGKAYFDIGEYIEAIPYLEQANLYSEVGKCQEKLGRFEAAARSYEEDQAFLEAARCYEQCKKYGLAAELYERHHQWLQAATNYYLAENNLKAAENFEKAEIWQSAADLYKLKAQWLKAAQLYQKCDLYGQAAEMYLKVKDKLDAARCYSLSGENEKAAKLHEAMNRWSEAGECYEQAGMFERAGSMYTKAGRLKEAAVCKEKCGDFLGAASSFERMKNWTKAAEAYLAANQSLKAAECFDMVQNWVEALPLFVDAGQWSKAARCAESLADYASAASYHAKSQSYNEAAYCYEKLEQWADAANYYLKAENLAAAGSMLLKLDRRLDAARLYMLAGQTSVGIEIASGRQHESEQDLRAELGLWAQNTSRFDLAAAVSESLNDYAQAGIHYKQAMMIGKAAECAEKVNDYAQAAELYMQSGNFERAANCFQLNKQIKRAAECFEFIKKWDEARKLYEQLGDHDGIQRCETASNWL